MTYAPAPDRDPRAPDRRARLRGRLRGALLLGIAVLFAASIPWYRETGARPDLVLGLPDWVAVALCCYAGVAVLNALAWLLTDVPEPPRDRDPG